MNKTERKILEQNNRRLYVVPGGSKYQLRPMNAVFINSSVSIRHELAKTIGAYCLNKYGDIPEFSPRLKAYLMHISAEISELTLKFPVEHAGFITEAVPKDDPTRRIDLLRLWDNVKFEFETRKETPKKPGAVTIYI